MKVNKSHLKGEIKVFPIEVVQRMCEHQVEQGNKFNSEVFANKISSTIDDGGFDWERTNEGYCFWFNVIYRKNFELFFNKYPKVTKDIVKWQNPTKDICKIKHRIVIDFDLKEFTKKGVNKLLKEKLKDIYKDIKLK